MKKGKNPVVRNEKNNSSGIGQEKKKRSRPVVILFLACFAIGFLLGWLTDLYSIKSSVRLAYKKSLKDTETESNQWTNQTDTAVYQFINPATFQCGPASISYEELGNFKPKLLKYVEKALEDKEVEMVSVYFRDLNNGIWIGINEKEKFAPASLNKVPVLIAVMKKAEKKPFVLKEKIQFIGSPQDLQFHKNSHVSMERTKLKVLGWYTVRELIEYMIYESDNEATNLLLDFVGEEFVRNVQKDLGIIIKANMNQQTEYISVKSYSTFFRVLYNVSYLNKEYSELALRFLSGAKYPYGIRAAVPEDIVVCHKYGERDYITQALEVQIQQLHHAAIVYYPGKPFLLNVMTKGRNKPKLQKLIREITEIVLAEVERQMESTPKTALEMDIEKE
jgi:beta-lactamase class A